MNQPSFMPVLEDHENEFDQIQPSMRYQGGDFATWRDEARVALASLMGVPLDRPWQINAQLIWEQQLAHGVVKKLLLHEPLVGRVLVYWCVPHEPRCKPMPAMICLQGHSTGMHKSIAKAYDEFTEEQTVGDRDLAIQCMKHGMAALCIEQRGFGQRRDNIQNSTDCHFMSVRAIMLGRSLLAERVMDVQVARHWLGSMSQVDANRVGIMGQSAGGTAATYASALTPGLRVTVPGCSFGPLRDVWFRMKRCMCGCVPGLLQLMDVTDVLSINAPNHVVVISGEQDPELPGRVAREGFNELQKRYAAAGANHACRLGIGPQGHRFYADLAWPGILDAMA